MPQTASEWDQLIGRCVRNQSDRLVESIRTILQPSFGSVLSTKPDPTLEDWITKCEKRWTEVVIAKYGSVQDSPYAHGSWTFGYDFGSPSADLDKKELLSVIAKSQGNETGWPAWWVPDRNELRPYPYDDGLECFIGEKNFLEPDHTDFWKASLSGKFYLRRGYREDGIEKYKPGTVFDVLIPIWRIGECLMHAHRTASQLFDAPVTCSVFAEWSGLNGRQLVILDPSRWPLVNRYDCRQDFIRTKCSTTTDNIVPNMPELADRLLKPLYEAFALFDVKVDEIQNEFDRMFRRARR
jgi:hypothetical protein